MKRLREEFDVAALGSSGELFDSFEAEGFEYHKYRLSRGVNPLSDLWTFGQLLVAFRRLGPQIVHTFDSKPGVWARLAARIARVPIVVGTLPGLGSLYAGETFTTRILRTVYQKLQQFACSVSDLTIFQNHDDADQFVEQGVVRREKTYVIMGSGVATEELAPERVSAAEEADLRHELGFGPDSIVVSMVSRVIRSKGVLDFMAAAQTVTALDANVHFLLVGPDDKESIDRLSKSERAELSATLCWPGPRQDIPVVLAMSDIFVLPSAYREGIPRVLLEAASMGLPIVTTDSPGCNEAVEDGVNGYLVHSGDSDAICHAVMQLIAEPDLRECFGRAGRKRAVQRFDLSVISEHTRSVYSRLLADVPTSAVYRPR
jgi:glycosyltransferase involved in cell wall biosynthesis